MRFFEVEYRRSPTDETDDASPDWRRSEKRPLADVGTIELDELIVGDFYDVRVRMVDDETGETSDWTTRTGVEVEKNAGAPAAPLGVRMTCAECIVWDNPIEVQDLRGALVRHVVENDDHWGRAEPAHEQVLSAPPFPLCAVPRGRRTYLVKLVDWDGNESDPAVVQVDRGPLNDAAEYTIREIDYQALLWPGDHQGAQIIGDFLLSTEADVIADFAPFWLSDLEPAWSVAGEVPAWTHDDASAWGKLWGSAAMAWRDSSAEDRWVSPKRWLEYVFSITVDSLEEGPTTVLSIDIETTARRWRLSYRRRYQDRAWTGNPKAPYWTLDGNPAWTDTPRHFVPWPGRLVGVHAGLYEFRLLCGSDFPPFSVTACKARLSASPRTAIIPAVPVTSLGGTRLPIVDETPWRKVVEVEAHVLGATDSRQLVLRDVNHAKGPAVLVFSEPGVQSDELVHAKVHGY